MLVFYSKLKKLFDSLLAGVLYLQDIVRTRKHLNMLSNVVMGLESE